MSSHADTNQAGWTDEEWAGMLRDAEAEVDSLKAENQQLCEALRRISDYGPMPLEVRRIANHALAAVGEE